MMPTLLESNDETLFFEVPSENTPGITYDVMYDKDHRWLCTCPQYYFRKLYCKHMKACADMLGISDTVVFEEVRT